MTTSGDRIVVDYNSLKVITGENSLEKAEFMAASLIGENGTITYYDDMDLSNQLLY